MLRKIRIGLAAVFWIGITLLFLDITGALHGYLAWMAKIQFLPAFLALNVGVVLGLVLLTLVFGRLYCSVICPLGVTQDIISHIGTRKSKAPYKYRKSVKWLRYGVLVLFIVCLVAGVNVVAALLAPYGAYGRMVNSLQDAVSGHVAWPTAIVALITLVVIGVLAFKGGRTYCNSICPVGTTLSFFSRFAMFRPMIDASQCVRCHSCERKCKAHCIEITKEKVGIDYSRCVDCFNCIDSCPKGGLKYRFAWRKEIHSDPSDPRYDNNNPSVIPSEASVSQNDNGRRAFMTGTAVAVGALAFKGIEARAQEAAQKVDGGLAEVLPKQALRREIPITPPGSKSVKHFYQHCIACQLCVAECPNGVLRPSANPDHLIQPEMGYEKGYCRPECTRCSQVCPAGAIKPITKEEKTQFHIGTAHVDLTACISATGKSLCGKCSSMCPVGAIHMVTIDGNPTPAVNEQLCIGCGACEQYCPVRPISAITVNGRYNHE